jgi:hypothetical protein
MAEENGTLNSSERENAPRAVMSNDPFVRIDLYSWTE